MGRHIFAKAGLIDAPPLAQAPADPLRASLEEQLNVGHAPLRRFIDRAPRDLRRVLTIYYEGCLEGPCVRELGWSTPGSEDRALNDLLARAGRERIARAPLNFARLTATDYESLWTSYKLRHPTTAPTLNALIAANRPLPFEREAFKLAPGDTLGFRPYGPVLFIQPAVTAIGWLTFGLALVGLGALAMNRPLPPSLAVACLAALTAHAGLLFSALFAAGIARFIVSLWPAIMTAVLFAAWSAWNARLFQR